MKQVPQNEIDVLLRKLGQDQAGATEVKSAHLDPDELSAYAENALPQAARAKYTEHLVDCSACRRLVTDLTPRTVLESKKEEARVSAVHQFFSKLTTPSFLRYAVPSLAAVLILAIGFFVANLQQSRRNRLSEMVAKNESPPQVATSAEPPAAGVSSVQNRVSSVQDSKAASPSDKKTAKTNTDESQPESTPAKAQAVDELHTQEEAEKRAEAAGRADAARNAAAEAPPPPKAPQPTVADQPEVAKNKVAETKQETVAEVRPIKEEARKLDDTQIAASTPKAQAAPQTRRARMPAPAGMAAGSADRDKQTKDNEQSNYAAETRRVAGRDFRKVNGVWTDTAYDGRETTNLSRGSEQFRALVADEPSLRTIADQLDGQIVVVWKGRAYRIR